MKLSCIQSNLRKGLAIVSRAVATRSTIPETQNVLIATDNGRLKLTATNLEIAITTWIGAQIEEEGSVTIPARMLSDFINSLPDKKVDIEMVPNPIGLKIHCANFDAQMNGIDPESYPPIPNITDGPKVSISSSDFKSSLSRVRFAVASDESRPALTGVKVDIKDNQFTLASADGFRLAVETGSCDSSVEEDVSVIVPGRTMNEIFSLLGSDSGMLDMTVTDQKSQALFKFGDIEVVTQLIQGNFPDYERIIPSNLKNNISISKSILIDSIKLITSLFSDYADKHRFLYVPKGKIAAYQKDSVTFNGTYQNLKGENIQFILKRDYTKEFNVVIETANDADFKSETMMDYLKTKSFIENTKLNDRIQDHKKINSLNENLKRFN